MSRRAPITPLPRDLALLCSVLEQALGFVVPLLVVCLVRVEGGLTLTPAATTGTTLLSTSETTDWLDSGADSFRLVGWGVDTGAVGITAKYVVNTVTLASVVIPVTTAGAFIGAWTPLVKVADRQLVQGDRLGHIVLVGNGIGATTIKSLSLQVRTVSRTT